MRCGQCRVDLSEGVSACPLCGEPAQDEPSALAGIKTAEYPKVQYRNYRKNYSAIFLLASAAICVFSGAIELVAAKKLDITMLLACLLPCIWSLAIRPIASRRLSVGNYLVVNVFLLSLLLLRAGDMLHIPVQSTASYGIAALFFLAALILLFVIVAKKNKREHRVLHLLMLAAAAAALLIFVLTTAATALLPGIAFAMMALDLCLIVAFNPKKAKKEFKALFHI